MIEEIEDIDELNEEEEQAQGLFEHFRLEADSGQALLRIDKFLVDRIPNASRTKIQDAAEAGNILVNGKPVKPNYKIKPKEVGFGDDVSSEKRDHDHSRKHSTPYCLRGR